MRITNTLTAAGAIVIGAALATVIGAGFASAATPIVDLPGGKVGLSLSNAETGALANSPIPALVAQAIPGSQRWATLEWDSQYDVIDGKVHASQQQILAEAAAHPGGYANVYVGDPNSARSGGYIFQIYQHWN